MVDVALVTASGVFGIGMLIALHRALADGCANYTHFTRFILRIGHGGMILSLGTFFGNIGANHEGDMFLIQIAGAVKQCAVPLLVWAVLKVCLVVCDSENHTQPSDMLGCRWLTTCKQTAPTAAS